MVTSWADKTCIGVPVFLVGLAMNYGLFRLMPNPTESLDSLFYFMVFSAYEIVANLLVFVGFKKMFGSHAVFDRVIGHSLKRLIWILLAVSLIAVTAALLAAMAK